MTRLTVFVAALAIWCIGLTHGGWWTGLVG